MSSFSASYVYILTIRVTGQASCNSPVVSLIVDGQGRLGNELFSAYGKRTSTQHRSRI
jgi:hypothetical protein